MAPLKKERHRSSSSKEVAPEKRVIVEDRAAGCSHPQPKADYPAKNPNEPLPDNLIVRYVCRDDGDQRGVRAGAAP
jgi:hypothetical protein